MTPSPSERHLTVDEAAAYLDHRIGAPDRSRLAAHLSQCTECRTEVVGLLDAVTSVRKPRRRALGGGLVAAAAALLFIVVRNAQPPTTAKAPELRGDATTPRIVAYAPAGEVATTVPLRFVWGAQKGALSYRLTVSNATGAPVWSVNGTDTAVAMPPSVALDRDADYFWVVDALLSDGTTTTTGLREFTPLR